VDFDTLWRDGVGFWRVWVVTLGRRHRLFDGLHRRAANDAVRVWREAAQALGLIVRRRGQYAPATGVRSLLLDPRHPEFNTPTQAAVSTRAVRSVFGQFTWRL